MANFEVSIDKAGFRRVKVVPIFNEKLYGELLDEFAPDTQSLQVVLTPHLGWGRNPLGMVGMMLARRDDYEVRGTYGDNIASVHCVKDETRTNRTLLHETKHYIDDTTGELEAGVEVMRRSGDRVLEATAATGIGIGTALAVTNVGDPFFGVAAIVPAVPLMYRTYWRAPHEVAARQFAVTPEVAEVYGRIISYRQAC